MLIQSGANIKQIHDVEKSLVEQISVFEKQSVENYNKQAQEFEKKVSGIKQTFNSAMDQLLSVNGADSKSNVMQAENHCKRLKAATSKASSDMVQSVDSNSQVTCSTMEKVISSMQSQTTAIGEAVQLVNGKSQLATTHLKSISDAVMTKKSNLDTTVKSVVGHVQSEMAVNCDTVKQTSATATQLYRQIKDITGTMDKSSSEALDNFNGLLRGEGMVLETDLKSHFAATNEFIATQQTAVVPAILNQMEAYSSSLEAMGVPSTGSTPQKKQPFQPVTQLPNTRAHESIKAEAKAGAWEMPRPSYIAPKARALLEPRVSDISTLSADASIACEESPADEDAVSVHSAASTNTTSSKQSKRKFGTIQQNNSNLSVKPSVEAAVSKIAKVQVEEPAAPLPSTDAENMVCAVDDVIPAVAATSTAGLRRPSKIGTVSRKASVTSVR